MKRNLLRLFVLSVLDYLEKEDARYLQKIFDCAAEIDESSGKGAHPLTEVSKHIDEYLAALADGDRTIWTDFLSLTRIPEDHHRAESIYEHVRRSKAA